RLQGDWSSDVCSSDLGSYFYTMEFVEGETLETLIKRSSRLEVKARAGNRHSDRLRFGRGAQTKPCPPRHQTSQRHGQLGGWSRRDEDYRLGTSEGSNEFGARNSDFDSRQVCWHANTRK